MSTIKFSSSSSNSARDLVRISSTISLPRSCSKKVTSKIENLVEYSYVPEGVQVSKTPSLLLNPYNLYKRPSTVTMSIRTLISTHRPNTKEYVQSSKLDQCSLRATSDESYVDLEIPKDFISSWKSEGYTHFHMGAVRVIITLHGRK